MASVSLSALNASSHRRFRLLYPFVQFLALRVDLHKIIDTLKGQRIRQGDYDSVLASVMVQAALIRDHWPTGPLAEVARQMDTRAREIQRMKKSVPKFV